MDKTIEKKQKSEKRQTFVRGEDEKNEQTGKKRELPDLRKTSR